MRKTMAVVVGILCVSMVMGCAAQKREQDRMRLLYRSHPLPERAFTKYNIHCFQRDTNAQGETAFKASFLNWTDTGENHVVIPPNTPVKFEVWYGGKMFFSKSPYAGYVLYTNIYGQKIYFEYEPRYMEMSYVEYANFITSPEPVSLEDFSDLDLKGIKMGKALPGMTKDGVAVALGYPAVPWTPSFEANQWIYWTRPRVKMSVNFNALGLVVSTEPR